MSYDRHAITNRDGFGNFYVQRIPQRAFGRGLHRARRRVGLPTVVERDRGKPWHAWRMRLERTLDRFTGDPPGTFTPWSVMISHKSIHYEAER